jgi:hypothetical protein
MKFIEKDVCTFVIHNLFVSFAVLFWGITLN